jgi:putative transcriptional regulator
MNQSYKGKILISTPDISGDIFSRSVVLIVDHDEHGAFGFILNKKSFKMNSELVRIFGTYIELYEGGPVEKNKIFFLTKGVKITENFNEINDEFYVTDDFDQVVKGLNEKTIKMKEIKIFSGYSGWGSKQLDEEVNRKMWTVVDAYNLDYTLPNDQTLWKNIMQNLGGEYLLWANAPENISMN